VIRIPRSITSTATLIVVGSLALGCANDVAVFPGSGGGGVGAAGTGGGTGGGVSATSGVGGTSSGTATTSSGVGGGSSTSTTTSGAGGGGSGPGPCKTCADALQGFPGPLCPGSEPLFDAVTTCACINECPLECFDSCNGMPSSPACEPCMYERCFVELDVCFSDV